MSSPYIYHPHDLQHRHLPEFFTKRQRAWREVVYGNHCKRATAVAVGTTWVKEDIISQMGVPAGKIFVVPLAPIDGGQSSATSSVELKHVIPAKYLIYPAASWPHKNHARLFEAIAALRSTGTPVHLVITGAVLPGLTWTSS